MSLVETSVAMLAESGTVRSVFGEPIRVEGRTVVPVARVTHGFDIPQNAFGSLVGFRPTAMFRDPSDVSTEACRNSRRMAPVPCSRPPANDMPRIWSSAFQSDRTR